MLSEKNLNTFSPIKLEEKINSKFLLHIFNGFKVQTSYLI